jgi:hypothetical protein
MAKERVEKFAVDDNVFAFEGYSVGCEGLEMYCVSDVAYAVDWREPAVLGGEEFFQFSTISWTDNCLYIK